MTRRTKALVSLAALLAACWFTVLLLAAPRPAPAPACPDGTCPRCPHCHPENQPYGAPWGEEEPAVDLLSMPADQRKRNITAKGAGCCTFRSAEYAAYWQNVPALHGLPEWLKAKGYQGGGIPSKQARMVEEISRERSLPVPGFVQYQGRDPQLIELALRTGRLPCVTWGGNHMLCCVHLDQSRGAILDNNAPDRAQWMTRQQFLAKWTAGGGGWVFVLTAPPPAPAPRSAARPRQDGGCFGLLPLLRGLSGGRGWCPLCGGPASAPKIDPGMADGVRWGAGDWHPGYSVRGRPATEEEAAAALTDDSGKPHLSLIGTPQERAQALARAGDVSRYLVQQYEPGDWALRFGHAHTGRPTVYLQARDGRVLLRHDGQGDLAGALRRADPAYDPKADPTGTPALPGLDLLAGLRGSGYLPYLAGALGLGGAYLLTRKPAPGAQPAPAPAAQAPAPRPAGGDDLALELGRRQLARLVAGLDAPPPAPQPAPRKETP